MTDSPGAKIKYLRTISEMSQEELGRRVGVQRAAINKYEKGTVENIPLKTIEKIANVFEVSPSFIVGWNETSTNPLSAEVKLIQGVKHHFGEDCVELLEDYIMLTPQGQRRLQQYAKDMRRIYMAEL